VWDEAQSGHTTAGTFGKHLDTEISGVGGGSDNWTDNEVAEIKTVLGVTGTGTPDSTPSDGALYALQGSTFNTSTDSNEAIRDRGDAAWTTGAGGSAPTVEEIRAEMDTNSTKLANLDATLSSRASASALTTHDGKLDTVDANVDAILLDTGTDGVIVATNNDKTGYRLSATGVDDILEAPVEGKYTLRDALCLAASSVAGKLSTSGGTATFRGLEDTENRMIFTFAAGGTRSAVTYDLTGCE